MASPEKAASANGSVGGGVQVPAEFSAEKLDQVGDAFDFSPEARRAELKKADELKEEAALQEWPFEFALGGIYRFCSDAKQGIRGFLAAATEGAPTRGTGASAYTPKVATRLTPSEKV